MQFIPREVQSLIFYQLDPAALGATFQVCKSWNSHMQEGFFAGYASTRSPQQIDELPPKLFEKLLPLFSQTQLFSLEGKRITRHSVHDIPETPINQLNLRIVKLLCSLDWYREIIQAKVGQCKYMWGTDNYTFCEQFTESLPYVHLFIVAYSDYLKDDKSKRVNPADFYLDKNSQLIKKRELLANTSMFHIDSAITYMDKLCANDDVCLQCIDPKARDALYQVVFSRYHYTHFISPRNSSDWFHLPTHFFTNFFDSLTLRYLERQACNVSNSQINPWEGFSTSEDYPGMKSTSRFINVSTLNPKRVVNCYYKDGFDVLKLKGMNSKKLKSLSKWLSTTAIRIDELILAAKEGNDITQEDLKDFDNCLAQSRVNKMTFFTASPMGGYFTKQIEKTYHSQNMDI